MSNQLIPRRGAVPQVSGAQLPRGVARGLSRIEATTALRIAATQGESMIASEKMHEVDRLARDAMTGQAFISQWASCLSRNDPILIDELRFYVDMAKMGKGEIILDTIDSFRRI